MHDPPHAGVILNEEFLRPLGLSLTSAAKKLNVNYQSLRYVIKGKKGISPVLALKLSRLLSTSPQFWLNMQNEYDLWQAVESEKKNLKKIKPVRQKLRP